MPKNISKKGIKFLIGEEGKVIEPITKKHFAYLDSANKPTIGYGHLIKNLEQYKNGISEDNAFLLLKKDLERFEFYVNKTVKKNLKQYEFDALTILAYNIGLGGKTKPGFTNSSLVKILNGEKPNSIKLNTIEKAWLAWNIAGSKKNVLLKRRRRELELFKTGNYNLSLKSSNSYGKVNLVFN